MSSPVSRCGQGSEVLVASVRPAILQVQQPRVSPCSTAWCAPTSYSHYLFTIATLQGSKQSPPQFRLPAWLPRGRRGSRSHGSSCRPLAASSSDGTGAEPEEPSEAYICKTTEQFAKEIRHVTEEAGRASKSQTLTVTHVVRLTESRTHVSRATVTIQCCLL